MAIEHKTLLAADSMSSVTYADLKNVYNAILNAYAWEDGSKVVETADSNSLYHIYGQYYFTKNSYLQLRVHSVSNFCVTNTLVTPTKTITFDMYNDSHATYSIGTTSKGIAISAWSGASDDSRDVHDYNLFIGEITLLDGTVTKGCIRNDNYNNNYVVATDKGISEESTFISNIDSTKKSYLAPVTDSTYGGTFKDIYMMFCSPIQYNKMKIADTDKKYLCGKAICLAD